MSEYDTKSCNALEKAFYTPMEVAIRWCNLVVYEVTIINALEGNIVPNIGQFPKWPCLRVNAEKIIDAINNDSLPHGRDGKTVQSGEHVAPPRRTVRHTDLKKWMTEHYPDQKPVFLFDETERKTHAAINADSFRALQADRDSSRIDLERKAKQFDELIKNRDSLLGENQSLRAMVEKHSPLNERAETTYLNIVGSLLELLLGSSSSGKPYSSFETQEAVISAVLAYHEHKQGISARTLQEKFAAANRSLKAD